VRLRQLARDASVETRVLFLPLLLQRERGQLQRVKNVAQVKPCKLTYVFRFFEQLFDLFFIQLCWTRPPASDELLSPLPMMNERE